MTNSTSFSDMKICLVRATPSLSNHLGPIPWNFTGVGCGLGHLGLRCSARVRMLLEPVQVTHLPPTLKHFLQLYLQFKG